MNSPQLKIKYYKLWTIQDVRNNPDHLFIFGDNDQHKGRGGQAIIRGQQNAFGIPTKKYPSFNNNAFYTDTELIQNKIKIDQAINKILASLPKYKVLVFPEDGLGTGLAQLNTKAPLTFKYLNEQLSILKSLSLAIQ